MSINALDYSVPEVRAIFAVGPSIKYVTLEGVREFIELYTTK